MSRPGTFSGAYQRQSSGVPLASVRNMRTRRSTLAASAIPPACRGFPEYFCQLNLGVFDVSSGRSQGIAAANGVKELNKIL
jgi:hypothetical protein